MHVLAVAAAVPAAPGTPPWATVQQLAGALPTHVWLAAALVLLLQRLAARLGLWPYALLALPGTLAHELAHYLVARLLGARPSLPSLWPVREAGGWRLGSVRVAASWWRALPIALAPLALLPGGLLWLALLAAPADGAAFVLHAWIGATLLNAGLPSRADLRLALPALALLAAVGLGWLVLHPGALSWVSLLTWRC